MNKRANKDLFLAKIVIVVALVAIFGAMLWGYWGQDTVAVQSAKEAYSLYMIENPEATDKDFIYIYEDAVIVAIRNGKVVRKEYATEADAVKAALGSKDGLNYSLSGTGNGKLFVVKLFEKTDDIYALGSSTLATGAEKLTIKVVSNGMIFATFEIPAEAIDRKQSPVGVTIKKIDPEDNVKLGKNETGFAYDIDVDNLIENNTSLIKVTMNGPKGLSPSMNKKAITVYHKNKAIASTYDPAKGEISFETTDFSPYTFTYEMVPVNSLKQLREQLGLEASGNIILGDDFAEADENGNIVIDLTTNREQEDNENVSTTNDVNKTPYNKLDDLVRYYAKGKVNGVWHYFGALVIGDMTIDLNGKTIIFKGDAGKNDAALFAVGNNSSLTIIDSSKTATSNGKGTIKVPYDQHAIWSVDYTSAVSIHGGNFVKEAKSGTQTGRALLYSSGGKINVYAGSSFDFGTDENGGFNVLDKVGSTRIWIHEGVLLKNSAYCSDTDKTSNRIVLVGGADLKPITETVDDVETPTGWYKVQGQKLQVKKTLHIDKMLYRVGNKNEFSLGVFFEAIEGSEIPKNISVRVVDIIDTDNTIAEDKNNNDDKFDPTNGYYGSIKDEYLVEGTDFIYSAKTDWTTSTIKFSNSNKYFSGPVRLELIDANDVVYASIALEVVNGTNMTTTAVSPSTNKGDVCMLQDFSSTSKNAITVSNGFALYGNGFTITDNRLGSTDNTKDKNGIIKIEDGTLDNVRIVGYKSTVDKMAYNGKTCHAPAVLITGNANIYNSYIYGGQSAVLVMYGGTVLLDNVTLDGGRLSNMQILGGADVTLRDCVTTKDTQGGKGGLGIVVSNIGASINLEGTFTQHNWITKDQIISDLQSYLNFLYTDPNYAKYAQSYDSNGDGENETYVNMGIFFGDSESFSKPFTKQMVTGKDGVVTVSDEDGMLTDTTATSIKYQCEERTNQMTVTAYLPTTDLFTLSAPAPYAPVRYSIYKPTLTFDNTNNTSVGKECTYNSTDRIINIKLVPDANGNLPEKVKLDLSGIDLKRYGYDVSYDLSYFATDTLWNNLTESENEIKITNKKEVSLSTSERFYKIVVRTYVSGCTPSGVRDDSVYQVYTYTLTVNIIKDLFGGNAPTWNATTITGEKHLWLESGNAWLGDPDWQDALPIFNNLKGTFITASGETKTFDLTYQTDEPEVFGNRYVVVFTEGDLKGCALEITSVRLDYHLVCVITAVMWIQTTDYISTRSRCETIRIRILK